MAKILFYDLETNSLDVKRGYIQEIAWAVFDLETKRCLSAHNYLLSWGMAYSVDPGALAVTGLTRDYCEKHGEIAATVLSDFVALFKTEQVQYVAGHNILQFDNHMLNTNVKRALFDEFNLNDYRCLDTYLDVPYPPSIKNLTLKYLALDHGYVLTGAHQALQDVFACAHIFFSYKTEDVLEKALNPIVMASAYTSYTDTESREQLVGLKFRWNRLNKRWEKQIRESDIDAVRSVYFGPIFINDVLYEGKKVGEQFELPF